jgi:hypothetical protein
LSGLLTMTMGLGSGFGQDSAAEAECRGRCVHKMRKLFEAIQAYRRLHGGKYPDKTASLEQLGLLPEDALICPSLLESRPLTAAAAGVWRSSGEHYDLESAYQYELAEKPIESIALPLNTSATWRQVKMALIGRAGWEEVPILRCSRHSGSEERLNYSFSGRVYTSGINWEELFVDTVPLTYRSPYMALLRSVPPFVNPANREVEVPETICLAPACNSFPNDPWWWGNRVGPDGKPAATLQPLLDECPGGVLHADVCDFDVRYLVQVQGAQVAGDRSREGYVSRCFPGKVSLPIHRHIGEAIILSGTVWRGRPGEVVGKLVWHRMDGTQEETALVYGEETERFQGTGENGEAKPVWKGGDPDHSLRLFATRWRNGRPESPLTHVELIADPASIAAPFVAAITIRP